MAMPKAMEMPGVEKGDLEITVDNGELVILGRRKPTKFTAELIYREIQPHDFRRVYGCAEIIAAACTSFSAA